VDFLTTPETTSCCSQSSKINPNQNIHIAMALLMHAAIYLPCCSFWWQPFSESKQPDIFHANSKLNLDLFGFDWMGLFSGGGFSSIFFSGVF
jgi:hypothetical protein